MQTNVRNVPLVLVGKQKKYLSFKKIVPIIFLLSLSKITSLGTNFKYLGSGKKLVEVKLMASLTSICELAIHTL